MLPNDPFLRETVVDVDAAVVGVSSARWTSAPSDATPDTAALIMRKERFDVLPIEAGGGFEEYFLTNGPDDYSSIVRKRIDDRDVISFATPLREVIKRFALVEQRRFYFLGDERRIIGLISIANLNCRQVGVYLFSLVSELEIELGNFIAANCTESEVVALTFGKGSAPKYDNARKRYVSDKAKGVDVPVMEYLYLSDMINVIKKKKLFEKLGYESAGKYENALGPLVDLRDRIAHPTRSLLEDSKSGGKLWSKLDCIERTLSDLRSGSTGTRSIRVRSASGQS